MVSVTRGLTTLIVFAHMIGWAQIKAVAAGTEPVEIAIVCSTGLTSGDCEFARDELRLALSSLRASIPDWRFVVVPGSQWIATAEGFRVKVTVPAFSNFAMRTTYVESVLVFPELRIDENLQRYTRLRGIRRLEWMMAHEYGHILCRTRDEKKAESAAGRLMYGSGRICR